MKRFTLVNIMSLILICFCWSCSHQYATMWGTGISPIQVERLPGNARYEILGDTEGRATVTRIFFWHSGDDNKHTNIWGTDFPYTSRGRAEQAAAYNAIENFAGADQLIAPRFKTEEDRGFLSIWTTYSSTVKAKAIKTISR